ncbi:MAG: SRPBCC family protein [Acidimicrobiales bacterium]
MGSYVEQDLAWADRAPIVVEATGTVAGTAQEVWDAIVDYPRWAAWFPQIAGCHATSEPSTGLGSTRDVRLKGGGGTIGERFIAWDEPRVWAFTATSGPPVFTSIVERVTIERAGDDRASVTYRMALAAAGAAPGAPAGEGPPRAGARHRAGQPRRRGRPPPGGLTPRSIALRGVIDRPVGA